MSGLTLPTKQVSPLHQDIRFSCTDRAQCLQILGDTALLWTVDLTLEFYWPLSRRSAHFLLSTGYTHHTSSARRALQRLLGICGCRALRGVDRRLG